MEQNGTQGKLSNYFRAPNASVTLSWH